MLSLAKRFYDELLKSNPDFSPGELEDFAVWEDCLSNPGNSKGRYLLSFARKLAIHWENTMEIFIAVDDVLSSNPTILGGAVIEHFHRGSNLLLTYIATSPLARGKGVASFLIKSIVAATESDVATFGSKPPPLFAECHRPSVETVEANTLDSLLRLKIFESLGFVSLPEFPYAQPALSHDDAAIEGNLCLLMHSSYFKARSTAIPESFPSSILCQFMAELWGSCGEFNSATELLEHAFNWCSTFKTVGVHLPTKCANIGTVMLRDVPKERRRRARRLTSSFPPTKRWSESRSAAVPISSFFAAAKSTSLGSSFANFDTNGSDCDDEMKSGDELEQESKEFSPPLCPPVFGSVPFP